MNATKEYIGDGVYGEVDGYMIKLTTERHGPSGLGPPMEHVIFLEPEVFASLIGYAKRVWGEEAVQRWANP